MRKIALLLILSTSAFVTAHADEASKRAKAEEVLQLLHTDRVSEQIMGNIMKQAATIPQQVFGANVPPESQAKFDALQQKLKETMNVQIGWKALQPQYIDLYAKTYSEPELDGIITFYKSPTGQAMIARSPELAAQSAQIVQARMTTLQPQLRQLVEDFIQSNKPAATQPPPTLTPAPAPAPKPNK